MRILKIIFKAFNGLLVLLFLIGCLSPWVSPASFWLIGFISLIMPYLILYFVVTFILFILIKPWTALIPLITLALGFMQIQTFFAYRFGASFNIKKEAKNIRIITWNVRSFNGLDTKKERAETVRFKIMNSINHYHPDIICLQEFNNSEHPVSGVSNIDFIRQKYPYCFFSKDYSRAGSNYHSGTIIFSKYPIADSNRIPYKNGESIIYADIVLPKDTIRIYTTHLQSFKFKKEDYDGMDKVVNQDDEAVHASKSIIRKMKKGFLLRTEQANTVRAQIDESHYPSIICGDFNDVPNSYTYFKIKGKRQDAFIEKSFGIGKTYYSLAPTLRIDYMLPDNHFAINQFDLIDENLSDHYMLIGDVILNK